MLDRRQRIPSASLMSSSPSFSTYSADRIQQIAARVIREIEEEIEKEEVEEIEEEEEEKEEEVEEEKEVEEIEEEEETGAKTGNLDEIYAANYRSDMEDGKTEATAPVTEDAEVETKNSDPDEFEFSFVCLDPGASPITAEEIFANGQIRPLLPIFNRDVWFEDSGGNDVRLPPRAAIRVPLRDLLAEDQPSPSPSPSPSKTSPDADETTSIPRGPYSVWTAAPAPASAYQCKKSNSTGSSKRWRLRDLLRRSSSEGKETFMFLSPSATGRAENSNCLKGKNGIAVVPNKAKVLEGACASRAHEMHYLRNRAMKQVDRRRSFLPYRPDIVGFFANVNGISRNVQTF